ncbi:MAG TPA: hypothetical protein VGV93_01870 [Acidimicrobiales bacterium]|nr:hypothetical protein [Acidimicrobiales bacterium]
MASPRTPLVVSADGGPCPSELLALRSRLDADTATVLAWLAATTSEWLDNPADEVLIRRLQHARSTPSPSCRR